MEITGAQLAKCLRVTHKTICEWVKLGMPKAAHGRYNIFQTVGWWMDNINRDPTDESTADARERYWNAKAEQAEISVKKEKELLFPRTEISTEWVKRISEVKQGLLSLPVKLPPLLDGKPQDEMRPVIKDAVFRLLTAYSRDGRFTPQEKEKKKK